jgi:ABC-2 type transport system ATP-binding protein
VSISTVGRGELDIAGLSSEQIGLKASEQGIVLFELTPRHVSLEQAFMDLTRNDVEYRAHEEVAP